MNESSCGCCQGTTQLTPATIVNRPGLAALAYRIGTHATFFESMKARLSSMAVGLPGAEPDAGGNTLYPLTGLTTRSADVLAIALLDSWATVGDVLTFYQERIANEGYLRTATERRSVLELAQLVGYSMRPGVAATVYLAYTIEPAHPEPVEIATGARVQSVPGPGELPQSFETSEKIEARAVWNTLKPRMTRPQTAQSIINLPPDPHDRHQPRLYLKGIATNLKPNDPLLIDFGSGPDFYRVKAVAPDAPNERTLVWLQPWIEPRTRVARSAASMALDGSAGVLEGPAYVDAVLAIIDKYLDLESFNVDPNREMAQRVAAVLKQLHDSLDAAMPPDELTALLRDRYLPQLRAEQTQAIEGGYTLLGPWVSGLVAELEQALAWVPQSDDECEPTPVAEPDPLINAIKQLAKAPSVPPKNSAQLERDVATLFASKADMGLQVAGTFLSEQRNALPITLANARATPPSALRAFALRVKAAPFGHNAPPKPVRDQNGVVVDSEEWLLAGTETIGVRLALSSGTDASPMRAELVVERASQTETISVQLPTDTGVEIAGMRVTFGNPANFSSGDGFTVTFARGPAVIRGLRFRRNSTTNEVNITITAEGQSDPVQTIRQGQRITRRIGARNIIFDFSEDQFEAPQLSVFEERALPIPAELRNQIALDATYDQIVPQSWVAIVRAGNTVAPLVTRVRQTDTVSLAAYNITGKVTQLTLEDDWWRGETVLSDLRTITVFAQSEALELAEEPIVDEIADGAKTPLELDSLYSGLQSGRWLILSGERTDVTDSSGQTVTGVKASELLMLAEVSQDVQRQEAPALRRALATNGDEQPIETPLPGDRVHTYIKLAKPLAYRYKRDTVAIYGNVVKATHGETRNEVLGSGDGSKALQSFTLRQPPLTYVPASTPAGAESTLKVYVNNVEWRESDALAGLTPSDRRFITRTDDEDKTTVIFGNGREGARLPTGVENVKAVYRNGIGKPGNAQAEQISLLATRPLGVKGVINPLRASGGADRESRDQARRNIPLALMALDRLVSAQDYADFARTFAGIGKAAVKRLTEGRRQLVHLTIAGADDIPIEPSSDLYRNLTIALRQFGDPDLAIQVDVRELLLLVISTNVRILPGYLWEPVAAAIRTSLLDTFSFERRLLGQDALLSEVLSAIQSIEGVAYVDVDLLRGIPEKTADEEQPGQRRLLTPAEITARIGGPLTDAAGNRIKEPLPRIVVNLAEVETGLAATIIRPAQLAFLSPDLPDTLILNQIP